MASSARESLRRMPVRYLTGLVLVIVAVAGTTLLLPGGSRVFAATCAPGTSPGPDPTAATACEAPLDADGADRASGTAGPSGPFFAISTDGSADGANVGDPVETIVAPSVDGFVA